MNPQPPEAAFYHFNAPAARIIVLDGSNIVFLRHLCSPFKLRRVNLSFIVNPYR